MDYRFLSTTALFRGLAPQEVEALAPCLGARERAYAKNEAVLRAGSRVTEVGLVLSGAVNVVANLYWGSSVILGHVGRGDLFAENYALLPDRELVVDVVAAEASRVAFFDVAKMTATCNNDCSAHNRLTANLLTICARKNMALLTRTMHTTPHSIRGRLVSYLSEQAAAHGEPAVAGAGAADGAAGGSADNGAAVSFDIPFNRQQLADYLNVDRSSLCRELSRMRAEGLVDYDRNRFTLLRPR